MDEDDRNYGRTALVDGDIRKYVARLDRGIATLEEALQETNGSLIAVMRDYPEVCPRLVQERNSHISQLLERANQRALLIDDTSRQTAAYLDIEVTRSILGQTEQAMLIARDTHVRLRKAVAYSQIAAIQAIQRQTEQATQTLEQATQITNEITDPYDKSKALTFIARSQAIQGQTEQATQTLEQATQIMREITGESAKNFILYDIARSQAILGQTEQAAQTLELAINNPIYAEGTDEIIFFAGIVTYIKSEVEALIGNYEQAFQTAGENPIALAIISKILAEKGNYKQASQTLDRASQSALKYNLTHRPKVGIEIAKAQLQLGHLVEALRTLPKINEPPPSVFIEFIKTIAGIED